ncbi:hypothetical protein [Streptomyces triticiradicis]|uniref:Pentapeptide repeat-containing protein n=1 Tax=Streptomyces triticiradicis TaxID=2651189 RepID=A0A7J5DAN9_9ACTN|nr:hypothetical protein [Streptomyces triticiradicis]KAB1982835.1 hypothetical protein F8144_29950 [Streptomyces triticiradicis]
MNAVFAAVSTSAMPFACFEGDTRFESPTFHSLAGFDSVTFHDNTWFGSATFQSNADFGSAAFEGTDSFGPFVCAGQVRLSGAVFSVPVTMWIAARRLECRRTRWPSTGVNPPTVRSAGSVISDGQWTTVTEPFAAERCRGWWWGRKGGRLRGSREARRW